MYLKYLNRVFDIILGENHGFNAQDIFDCEYISPSGEIWLKDKKGTVVFVPLGEVQCFEDLE